MASSSLKQILRGVFSDSLTKDAMFLPTDQPYRLFLSLSGEIDKNSDFAKKFLLFLKHKASLLEVELLVVVSSEDVFHDLRAMSRIYEPSSSTFFFVIGDIRKYVHIPSFALYHFIFSFHQHICYRLLALAAWV